MSMIIGTWRLGSSIVYCTYSLNIPKNTSKWERGTLVSYLISLLFHSLGPAMSFGMKPE